MQLTRSEAMRLRHAVARVDGWLDIATPDDIATGLSWYGRAGDLALEMAYLPGAPSQRHCAGIIAALSPRQQWATNVRAAWAFARAAAAGAPMPAVGGLTSNRVKAWRIACGEHPDDVLSGPKVLAFYAAIMGDVRAITIDTWAALAAEGKRDPRGPSGRRYELLAESYRRVARKRGLSPRECQAAVWTVARRTLARATYDLH